MKGLFSILNLLLCFELIVSPIAPNLSLFGQKAFAESCQSGMSWDSNLNRCVTTKNAASIVNAASNCDAGDAACYRRNAEAKLQEKQNSGEISGRKKDMNSFVSSVASAATIAVPMTITRTALSSLKSPTCASVSYWGMVVGSAALFIGDLYASINHSREIKKLRGEWQHIVKPGASSETDKDQQHVNATEAQSKAFEMLARNEDAIVKNANAKEKFYSIAALAYATSTVAAGLELAPWAWATSLCTPEPASSTAETTAKVAAQDTAIKSAEQAYKEGTKSGMAETANNAANEAIVDEAVAGSTKVTGEALMDATINEAAAAGTEGAAAATEAANAAQAAHQAASAATEAANAAQAAQQAAVKAAVKETVIQSTGAGAIQGVMMPVRDEYHNLPQNTPIVPYLKNRTKFFDMKPQQWENNLIEKKNEMNLAQAPDLASFYILSQAGRYKYSSPSIEDYEKLKAAFKDIEPESSDLLAFMKQVSKTIAHNLSPIPQAQANGDAILNIAKGVVIGVAVHLLVKTYLEKILITPQGRLVASGVFAGWSMIMVNHAKSQAKASTNRAVALRKMQEEFNVASGAINSCKPADRNDPSKPSCYCYTSNGERNSNRGNSDICKNLFASLNITSKNYYTGADNIAPGCINATGSYDQTCACKKTPQGCMKSVRGEMKGLDIGSFKMLSSGFAPATSVTSGNFNAAAVNADANVNAAARMLAKSDDLLKKQGLEKVRAERDKKAAEFEKGLMAQTGNATMPSMASDSSPLPTSPREAAALLEKELKEENRIGGVSGNSGTVGSNQNEAFPEFGLTNEQANTEATQIAEVMKQDLDYGQNDINKGSTTNIFELLSNRYQRSGMRRLFDEKGTTQADAPSKTDISK